MTQLASGVMLSAFAMLIVKGLLAVIKTIIRSVADYFSSQNRLQRRVLFIRAKRDQFNRLFYFRTLQLRYFRQQKIKQLLNRNNRRQIQSLSKAIQKDIRAIKKSLPETAFKQLQQENRSCRNRQDIEALLKLQQKISTLTYSS